MKKILVACIFAVSIFAIGCNSGNGYCDGSCCKNGTGCCCCKDICCCTSGKCIVK